MVAHWALKVDLVRTNHLVKTSNVGQGDENMVFVMDSVKNPSRREVSFGHFRINKHGVTIVIFRGLFLAASALTQRNNAEAETQRLPHPVRHPAPCSDQLTRYVQDIVSAYETLCAQRRVS